MTEQEQDKTNKNQRYVDKIQELELELKKANATISQLKTEVVNQKQTISSLRDENHQLNVRLSSAYSQLHR